MRLKEKIIYAIGHLASIIRFCEEQYDLKTAISKSNQVFSYVKQGRGGLSIGHPENLKMDSTSHFKSNSFIECLGGGRNRKILSYRPWADYFFK